MPFDETLHTVDGFKVGNIDNPNYRDLFNEDSSIIGLAEGAVAHAEGTEIGTYEMGLTEDSFTNSNTDYKVTFNVHDGYLKVFEPQKVTVTIDGTKNSIDDYYYDGELHAAGGFSIYSDCEAYDEVLYEAVKYQKDGKEMPLEEALKQEISGTDAGDYELGLTPDNFINTDKRFDVTFEVENDLTMTINKQEVEVDIYANYEKVTYDGEMHSLETFGFSWGSEREDCPEYVREYIDYAGNEVIEATEMGLYTEKLDLEKFSNNNENFDVTFTLDEKDTTAKLWIERQAVTVMVKGNAFETTYNGQKQTLSIAKGTDGSYVEWRCAERQSFRGR